MQEAEESEVAGSLGRQAWTGSGLMERRPTKAGGRGVAQAGTAEREESCLRAEETTLTWTTWTVRRGIGGVGRHISRDTATKRERDLDEGHRHELARERGRERRSGGRCREELHQIATATTSSTPKKGDEATYEGKAAASGWVCCGLGGC